MVKKTGLGIQVEKHIIEQNINREMISMKRQHRKEGRNRAGRKKNMKFVI